MMGYQKIINLLENTLNHPTKVRTKTWVKMVKTPLINCETNLTITLSTIYFTIDDPVAGQEPAFTITDIKLYVPVLNLSIQDKAKLLEQLKSGFK